MRGLPDCVRACVDVWWRRAAKFRGGALGKVDQRHASVGGKEGGCAAFTKPTHASNPFNSLGAAILLVPLKVRKGCALVHATERPMSWCALNTNTHANTMPLEMTPVSRCPSRATLRC